MPNQYVNKVVQSNGTTLIDISDTTAIAADVASGKYFYLASGEKVAGTASGGESMWKDKKICAFGDSIGAGYNNNSYSFVDVLQEKGFFGSVHKNCVAGTTTSTLHARLIESESQIADADIIYCEYQYNDVVGLIGGTLTTNALLSALNTAYNYIRQRNATCQIVWMPLTISHFDKVGLTNASYFVEWAEAMYPAFAERGISLLPVYDDMVAGHAASDGKHPNTAGHKLIADHIMQAPLGTSNYNTALFTSADKQHLDAVYTDYSSALTAIG